MTWRTQKLVLLPQRDPIHGRRLPSPRSAKNRLQIQLSLQRQYRQRLPLQRSRRLLAARSASKVFATDVAKAGILSKIVQNPQNSAILLKLVQWGSYLQKWRLMTWTKRELRAMKPTGPCLQGGLASLLDQRSEGCFLWKTRLIMSLDGRIVAYPTKLLYVRPGLQAHN